VKSPDRLNRIVLGFLGFAATVAAAYGLARGYGAFGAASARDPFLLDGVRSFVGRNHDWFWPCAFVAALALAFVGFELLRAQFVFPAHELRRSTDDGEDRVVIARSVLAEAVSEDLEHDALIERATAVLTGTEDAPACDLALTVADDVDLTELRTRVVFDAMERARRAMESEPVAPSVILTLTDRARRRVL
jgi:hypothetical protein